jgi:hypothetical protein
MVAFQDLICTKAAFVDWGVTAWIRPTREAKDLDYRVLCRVPGEWKTVAQRTVIGRHWKFIPV